MNSMIIYEDPLHFEVSLLTGLLILILDESILKTIACAFVSNDFAREDLPEALKIKSRSSSETLVSESFSALISKEPDLL